MQRVAIGRALVRDPAIYLMDEPLSSLDAKLRAELRLELKRIQVELGATILYVTHDQVEAMTMASRIGVIKDGELLQLGTPREIYENPADRYVASRLGTPPINFLPAEPHSRGRDAVRHRDDRHPHRAPADRQSATAAASSAGAPHRASRRSKSRSSGISRPNAGDARRSASAAAGRPGRRTCSSSRPLYFDCGGTAYRGDGSLRTDRCRLQPETLEVTGASGRRAGDRQRAGTDRARSGDRRRRPRRQHEARLRSGAGQARHDRRAAARTRRSRPSARRW